MNQNRWFYWLVLLVVFWFVFGGIGFIWWIFPLFWLLPWLFSAQGWNDWDEQQPEKQRKTRYEPDWYADVADLEEPEYLETVDGERLQIIDDDGTPPPRLTIG